MTAFLICGAALLLDAASTYWLLAPIALPMPSPFVFLVVHGLASLLFGVGFHRVLPSPYKGTKARTGLFALTVAGLFPLLGICGLLGLVLSTLRSQSRAAISKDIVHTPIVPLPPHPALPFESARSVSEGYLAGLLEHSTDARQRLAALIATLSLQDGQAAPLLRLALKDHDDDVRLLAYALLDRKERAIESRIREQQIQLDQVNDDARFALHKALANDFWELARLNSGSAAEYLCRRAHEHGQAGLRLRKTDGGLQFLIGRIQLEQTQLDEARVAFENAEHCGIDSRTTSTYLAEIAFRQLRFTEAAQRLKSYPAVTYPRLLDFIGAADLAETNR
jgi:polysaccharide biosynthesis protein PelE